MPSIAPKYETRFWKIFRSLLLPSAAISMLLSIVMALTTALGGHAPVMDGREVTGVAGVLICLAAFPFALFLGAFGFTVLLYFNRTKLRRKL